MIEVSQLFTNIGTGIVTATAALIGVFLTNKENNKRLTAQFNTEKSNKYREVIREKLEELYIHFKKWSDSIKHYHEDYAYYLEGRIDIKGFLRLREKQEIDFDFARIQMLINLYFPDILPAFKDMREAVNNSYELLEILHSTHCLKPEDEEDFRNKFLSKYLPVKAEALEKLKTVEDLIIKQSNLSDYYS